MLTTLYIFIFIFGACIGSFLNAWIWRLHREESMIGRRSYCPKCKTQIKNLDLLPVLSFLFLGGKCRSCKQPISWQYPLVEVAVGTLFIIAFKTVVNNIGSDLLSQITLWTYWYFIAILIVIFVFDLKYYLILDKVTLPAIVLIFLINLLLGAGLINLLLGAIIGGGFFWIQHYISGGKWVGGGDIRLGALIGVMLGWHGTLITLLLAYVSGAAVGIGLLAARKKKMSSKVPFGTFLSAAAIITLLWGEQILEWYLGMIGLY
jgi:prepilin signal peptidase PulO-like enzyme (type II secretory pathway)